MREKPMHRDERTKLNFHLLQLHFQRREQSLDAFPWTADELQHFAALFENQKLNFENGLATDGEVDVQLCMRLLEAATLHLDNVAAGAAGAGNVGNNAGHADDLGQVADVGDAGEVVGANDAVGGGAGIELPELSKSSLPTVDYYLNGCCIGYGDKITFIDFVTGVNRTHTVLFRPGSLTSVRGVRYSPDPGHIFVACQVSGDRMEARVSERHYLLSVNSVTGNIDSSTACGYVYDMCRSAVGICLASDNGVNFYNFTGVLLGAYSPNQAASHRRAYRLRISSDGQFLYAGFRSNIVVIDAHNRTEIRRLDDVIGDAFDVSVNGMHLFAASAEVGKIAIVCPTTGVTTANVLTSISSSPCHILVASGSVFVSYKFHGEHYARYDIHRFDFNGNRLRVYTGNRNNPSWFVLSPSGHKLIAYDYSRLSVFDVESGAMDTLGTPDFTAFHDSERTLDHAGVQAVAFSTSRVYVGYGHGELVQQPFADT